MFSYFIFHSKEFTLNNIKPFILLFILLLPAFTFSTNIQDTTSVDILKIQNHYRNIAKKCIPAVVSLQVETKQIINRTGLYPFFGDDEFLKKFFGFREHSLVNNLIFSC